MWIIETIPFWVVNIMILVSVSGILISFFLNLPFVVQYKLPVQITSIVLLSCSIWLSGSKYSMDLKNEQFAELEAQLNIARGESQTVNEIIKYHFVDKPIEYQQVKIKEVIKRVPEYITVEMDKECVIPEEFIELHNEAIER